MPAVTVDDLSALPSITLPSGDAASGPAARSRPVESITDAPAGFEGEGFPVHRAFAGVGLDRLDPFVHMDQMGEVEYAPGEPRGTAWHPHRGFETVTYMIDGTFQHRDSTGGGGLITNGDTQWMTAGSGILHIERPPEALVVSGGLFHGIQLWVNLPAADKWVDPRYQDIGRDRITLLASPDGGALVRVIAGQVGDHAGPGITYTPITMVHASLAPGARLELPWDRQANALVYILAGRGRVGPDQRPIQSGQLAVLGQGDTVVVAADQAQDSRSPGFEVLMLGGRPIGEPVAQYGPFVMNTRAELAQAFEDFQKGRMGTIPAGPSIGVSDEKEAH
jgi:redox-sensitive bicupin YhaK (pirin superfamily)